MLLEEEIREELRKESDSLKMNGIIPRLAVILVGDDAASKIYVKNKIYNIVVR